MVFLGDGTATREMNGVLSAGAVASHARQPRHGFTQVATVQEVTEQIQVSSLADVASNGARPAH
jgi:hypothetical protein